MSKLLRKVFGGALGLCVLALASAAHASVVNTSSLVGTATDFAATSLNGGALGVDALNPSGPAGGTIAGGVAQGLQAPPAIEGLTFYWNKPTANLAAITIINAGGGGGEADQPFLLDLGASGSAAFTSGANLFIPNNFSNLLSSSLSVTFGAAAAATFEEMDYSGADAVSLQNGHNYFAGFVTSAQAWNFLRSNGLQAYTNGNSYIGTSLTQTGNITSAPYGGGPRTWYMGIYAAPAPEPGSFVLLGLAFPALLWGIRKRK